MNFEKFKSIFYSKDKKNKIKLEEQANNYLKMEMYDLYGKMIGNGYQPTKDQSIIVASFFVCYVLSIWRYNNFLKRKFSLVLLVVFTVLLLGANIANTPYCFVFQ